MAIQGYECSKQRDICYTRIRLEYSEDPQEARNDKQRLSPVSRSGKRKENACGSFTNHNLIVIPPT